MNAKSAKKQNTRNGQQSAWDADDKYVESAHQRDTEQKTMQGASGATNKEAEKDGHRTTLKHTTNKQGRKKAGQHRSNNKRNEKEGRETKVERDTRERETQKEREQDREKSHRI